jgi:hypothetical protein
MKTPLPVNGTPKMDMSGSGNRISAIEKTIDMIDFNVKKVDRFIKYPFAMWCVDGFQFVRPDFMVAKL